MARSSPEQLEPPLEYVRMYVDVVGWVHEAEDEEERQRLISLAESYLDLSIASCEAERERLTARLPDDVQLRLRGSATLAAITAEDLEVVRRRSAVTSANQLRNMTYLKLQALADMLEGWAQDPLRTPLETARLLGACDGLRSLAEVAGVTWQPLEPDTPSLTQFLADLM